MRHARFGAAVLAALLAAALTPRLGAASTSRLGAASTPRLGATAPCGGATVVGAAVDPEGMSRPISAPAGRSYAEPLAPFAGAAAPATVAAPGAAVQVTPAPCFAHGDWQGTVAGLRILIHLHARLGGGGKLDGTLDSPDQGAAGIALDRIDCNEDSLRFFCPSIDGEYVGARGAGDAISGTWSQRGVGIPLVLQRGEGAAAPRRPQVPAPPYPYDEDTVRVANAAAGISLAGTLTTPRTPGPHPAVLLLTGSGPQDRDETIFGHRPFLVIADALTRRGIAVLRLDDRGVGASSGDYASAALSDLVGDAVAAIHWLRGRPGLDPARIGLVGHSEGAMIAPQVAARDPRIAAIVLLAGPGMPGDELLLMQGDAIRRAAGADSSVRVREHKLQQDIFAVMKSEPDTAVALRRVAALIGARLGELPATARAAIADSAATARAMARANLSPEIRSVVATDPRVSLRKVRCPVLALGGSKDLQVPAEANLRGIARALREGGNRDATTRLLPGLNHLFQPATTGLVIEYGRIETTFAPAALDTMGSWLEARFAKRP